MTKVALLRCDDYDSQKLRSKIEEGLTAIGFDPGEFSGKRVAVKPNILSPVPVEKAVMTDPEFFRAVVRLIKDHGGEPVFVESPAIVPLRKAIQKTEYQRVVDDEVIEVVNDSESALIHYEAGFKFKRFEILKALFDVDIIVNLPKFKTHDFTQLTGSIKNLFGVVPGYSKARWHTKANNPQIFCEFLLDLYGALLHGFEKPKPILHIMDGIVGQDGDGPGPHGTPRQIGSIIVGTDGIAVDFIETQIACMDVSKVHIVARGAERGLGVASLDEIEIKGEPLDVMKVPDFRPPGVRVRRALALEHKIFFSAFFKNFFTERPVPREKVCTLCYQCREICASDAISRTDGKEKVPAIDYKKCIRCYCCMEICPEAAIYLKRGRLQWTMDLAERLSRV